MLQITKSIRRALGEGVSRLHDGDPLDIKVAEEVIESMLLFGFIYEGYDFISRDEILVVGHLHPHGTDREDLSEAERTEILTLIEGHPDFLAAVQENRFRELPDIVIQAMAQQIRKIRRQKGLRFEP